MFRNTILDVYVGGRGIGGGGQGSSTLQVCAPRDFDGLPRNVRSQGAREEQHGPGRFLGAPHSLQGAHRLDGGAHAARDPQAHGRPVDADGLPLRPVPRKAGPDHAEHEAVAADVELAPLFRQ